MARPPKSLTDAPPSSDSDALGDAPASYEAAVSELEQLVSAMEGGQMPLDDLLDSYRRGAVLLDFCRQRLKAVEDQVKILEDGQLKVWSEE